MLRSRLRISGTALAACLLAGGGRAHSADALLSTISATLSPAATAAQGCNWVKVFDPVVANVALPDTSAHYWLAVIPNPGLLGRIVLRGQIPAARHFSFNSYDALTSPFDAIADYQIAPAPPGGTPFLGPARVDRTIPIGASYVLQLAFQAVPQTRAPNTLYSDRLGSIGGVALPNPLAAVVIYRSYLPQSDSTGGGGLPKIVLQTAGGATYPVGGGERCSMLLHEILTRAGMGAVSALLAQSGVPDLPVPFPLALGAQRQPKFTISYGTGAALQDRGIPVPPILLGSSFAGFFSTQNNRYASASFSRSHGHLFLVRGKAPGFVDGGDAQPQLRYWSLCQNEFLTQRVVACKADHQTVLDAEGFYNVVVADAALRPPGADAAHGFNWLPWGAYYDAMFIVRHLLPAPDFAQAFHRVPRGVDPVSVAGDYFPAATYCEPAVLQAAVMAGASPREVFAACAAR